ncbi:hypothetical protein ACFL4R_01165 [Nitrospirota bacterium]
MIQVNRINTSRVIINSGNSFQDKILSEDFYTSTKPSLTPLTLPELTRGSEPIITLVEPETSPQKTE